MDHLLSLIPEGDVIPVVTVTSPRNTRMLRTLFRRRFVARWPLPDYFGPGKHRLGCQLISPDFREAPVAPVRDPVAVPVAAVGTMFSLMSADGLVLRDFVHTSHGPSFLLSLPAPGELNDTSPP